VKILLGRFVITSIIKIYQRIIFVKFILIEKKSVVYISGYGML